LKLYGNAEELNGNAEKKKKKNIRTVTLNGNAGKKKNPLP
jgi:hypothetical protein